MRLRDFQLPPLAPLAVCLIACWFHCGCSENTSETRSVLRIAVTTSTRDSGLLEQLLPAFESETNSRVDIIARGTGAALQLGRSGDVDALIVHARSAEDQFMQDGHGTRREDLMYNTFEIVGPSEDPAGVRSSTSPDQALQAIADSECKFVSRGDDSGTHQRELMLWQARGGRPEWSNYIESGQGMGATLNMAEEMNAYVLTDRGTFLKYRERSAGIRLVALSQPHEDLKNRYGIIVVTAVPNSAGSKLANQFVDFMVSPDTQHQIQSFQISGEPLFYTDRL